MNKIEGAKFPAGHLDKHSYICDLINFEGPLLSLYKDEHSDWLYLWCDTDGRNTDRWLIFKIERKILVDYLEKNLSLREVLLQRRKVFVLDKTVVIEQNQTKPSTYRHLIFTALDELQEYFPDEDSLFDESLTGDISVARDIVPEKFDIPIKGDWFLQDISAFSSCYTRLYSFLYCTKPRFVTNLGDKVKRYLRSPWKGGYSRVNFFDALHRQVPSVHDMRVTSYRYNSPGEITIEALDSVGKDVSKLVLSYIHHGPEIDYSLRAIDTALNAAKVKTEDLSQVSDTALLIPDDLLELIKEKVSVLSHLVELEAEVELIRSSSPNSIVTAKVVLALFKQLKKVAEFQNTGLLDLSRPDELDDL